MEQRALGTSGLMVSALGLGGNNFGRFGTQTHTQEGTNAVVHAAVDLGVTFFDVADVYGQRPGLSEEYLGKALAHRRPEVVLATKFGMDVGEGTRARGSRHYVMRAVEASLRRLGTEWIDLYQYHTPDGITPIEETLSALSDLVRSGKIRYFGLSNSAGWQIAEAVYEARIRGHIPLVSTQNHYNLLDRRAELEVLPAAQQFGLGLLPYFPLANGLLTGKYREQNIPQGSRLTHSRQHMLQEANWQQLEQFADFARQRGLSELEVALSWLASQPTVGSVIAGATTREQIVANAKAVAWMPSVEDQRELDRLFPRAPKIALF